MKRLLPAFCAIAAALAGARASAGGFVVFAATTAYNYEVSNKDLKLVSVAKARDPEDMAACAGRLFAVDPLFEKVVRLGPDLKEDRRVELGRIRGIVRILGSDERRIFIFFDNTLAAYDPELKSLGRVTLEAERRGDVVPVIAPDDFRVFADRGFLLSKNTGNIFVIDLKAWTADRLAHKHSWTSQDLKFQWIDPEKMTLNVLVGRRSEEHTPDLSPSETRIIKAQYVETFDLKALDRQPVIAKLHEEREIYKPYSEGARQGAEGIIFERIPPTRPDGDPQGVSINRLSRTTPTFALVYRHEGDKRMFFGAPDLVILKSGAESEKIEQFWDEAHLAAWFKHEGKVLFPVKTFRDNVLDIMPHIYMKLLETPAMKAGGASALAY